MPGETDETLPPREQVAIADLTRHPRNYRSHPEDQVRHLAASITEHGFYRNVVIARDGTILAGHGVVQAAESLGMTHVPATRLDLDPLSPAALKVLAADNEVSRFAENDDRLLTDLLKEIHESDEVIDGLLGTGYDEMMLASLLLVTRPESEIASTDTAAEWIGMPGYEAEGETYKVVMSFATNEDRHRFLTEFDLWSTRVKGGAEGRTVFSGLWPIPDEIRNDSKLRYEQADDDG